MENKQRILDLLLPALQETRNLHDLVELEYRADRELVYAKFASGNYKIVNVATGQAPVQTAPTAPIQPPVTPVPTTERTYTLDELANAAMTLMDKGMQSQLQELLASYGVEALPALPKNLYGNFATALRGMGANI